MRPLQYMVIQCALLTKLNKPGRNDEVRKSINYLQNVAKTTFLVGQTDCRMKSTA